MSVDFVAAALKDSIATTYDQVFIALVDHVLTALHSVDVAQDIVFVPFQLIFTTFDLVAISLD